MNLQFTLAARYLLGRKLRTALTTLAIIFGVVLIFGMNAVLPTVLAALQANVQGAEGNVDFSTWIRHRPLVVHHTLSAVLVELPDVCAGAGGVREEPSRTVPSLRWVDPESP